LPFAFFFFEGAFTVEAFARACFRDRRFPSVITSRASTSRGAIDDSGCSMMAAAPWGS
jgi:hypothetical protein